MPLLGITTAVAIASYELIEKPLRKRTLAGPLQTISIGTATLIATAGTVIALKNPPVLDRLTIVRKDEGIFQKGRQSQGNYVGPVTKRKNGDCGIKAEDLSQLAIRSSFHNCLWKGNHTSVRAFLHANDKLPVVAILGDSHAHQLFPIAEEIAKETGLPVYNYHYWGCLVPQSQGSPTDSKCNKVNKVPMWVRKELRRPIIFVIASIADPIFHFPSEAEQIRQARAYKDAFKAILGKGDRLIVVAPNPKFLDIDDTISDICGSSGLTAFNPLCNKDYRFIAESQRKQRSAYLGELGQWSAQDKRVLVVDPFDILCGERGGYCYAKSNGELKYWDFSHLNIKAVLSTYPLYKSAIEHIIKVNTDMSTAQ